MIHARQRVLFSRSVSSRGPSLAALPQFTLSGIGKSSSARLFDTSDSIESVVSIECLCVLLGLRLLLKALLADDGALVRALADQTGFVVGRDLEG